ncbi:MAG: Nicotinamide-nucleotide amidase, partial [uncultured Acetobacteraceae bacterium]
AAGRDARRRARPAGRAGRARHDSGHRRELHRRVDRGGADGHPRLLRRGGARLCHLFERGQDGNGGRARRSVRDGGRGERGG